MTDDQRRAATLPMRAARVAAAAARRLRDATVGKDGRTTASLAGIGTEG